MMDLIINRMSDENKKGKFVKVADKINNSFDAGYTNIVGLKELVDKFIEEAGLEARKDNYFKNGNREGRHTYILNNDKKEVSNFVLLTIIILDYRYCDLRSGLCQSKVNSGQNRTLYC